jgi:hypothetical protein
MEAKTFSIFSQVPARQPLRIAAPRLVRAEPPAATATHAVPAIARLVIGPRTASADLPPELQRAMLETLASKPLAGETIEIAYRRVERELGELFAKLTPPQARALKLRLEQLREGDILATRFNRLVVQRRVRLLAFLGDARRREALTNNAR